MGEVDRPLAGTVGPLLGVTCADRAREAADCMETAELPGKICLEEALSGILDKRLRPSPGIADERVISVVAYRYYLGGSEST